MFKRLLIAAILAAGVYDKWQYVLLMLGLELIFTIMRFCLERPKTTCEKVYIIIEWLLFSLAYVIMFFILQSAVTTFICMFIIFILIMLLFSDLLDVYLKSDAIMAEDLGDKPPAVPGSDRKLFGGAF